MLVLFEFVDTQVPGYEILVSLVLYPDQSLTKAHSECEEHEYGNCPFHSLKNRIHSSRQGRRVSFGKMIFIRIDIYILIRIDVSKHAHLLQ